MESRCRGGKNNWCKASKTALKTRKLRKNGMKPVKFEIIGGDFNINQEAAAVLAGVTVQSLILWDKQDNPPPRNPDGSYSAKNYGKWLTEFRGLKKRGPKPKDRGGEEGESYAEAERRLKLAQAIKVERENEVTAGNLMPVDMIEAQWQVILTRVRSRLLKMPTVLAPAVIGHTDAHAIQSIIKGAVVDALTELSEDWRDGDGEEGDS